MGEQLETKKKPHRKTGNPKGRPLKYTKETFDAKIDSYLELRVNGGEKGPVTLLDFCTYAEVDKEYISMHDLKDGSRGDFSVAIKRLKTKAERDLEYFMLIGKFNPSGAIFALKNNYGWKDKNETEHSGQVSLTSALTADKKIEQKKEF